MNANEQMRKALFDASIALSNATHNDLTEYDAEKCLAKVDAALALPRRNCDVGEVEEQVKRFQQFCISRTCKECPLYRPKDIMNKCFPHWSQLPYEEAKK